MGGFRFTFQKMEYDERRTHEMQPDRHTKAMSKTVIFEEKYGVDIEKFSTTSDVEKFIEDKIGRELQVIEPCGHGIVSTRGNIFKLRDYDINRMFDETINS